MSPAARLLYDPQRECHFEIAPLCRRVIRGTNEAHFGRKRRPLVTKTHFIVRTFIIYSGSGKLLTHGRGDLLYG
jgi:hypothetical protein